MNTGSRVLTMRNAQTLDHLARHGPHVGAAVALDLRLIAHPTHGEAEEGAPQGSGNGLADRGLADPRRPRQTDDRTAPATVTGGVGRQLADRQELEDPLLDVLQTVVIAIQPPLRASQVHRLRLGIGPGQRRDGLQVVAGYHELGRTGVHQREFLQLVVGALLDLAAQLQLVERFLQALMLAGLGIHRHSSSLLIALSCSLRKYAR